MTNNRTQMDDALRRAVVPALRKLGFMGSMPHFRRITENSIDLLTFQNDRNSGGFVIELAKAKNSTFTTHWGKEILPGALTAHDLNKRIRIYPSKGSSGTEVENWFRYDHDGNSGGQIFDSVAHQVLGQIGLIESLFQLSIEEWDTKTQ